MNILCANCKFWRFTSRDEVGDLFGECRRSTPIVTYHETDEFPVVYGWPVVEDMDWCGEFKSKKERAS